ncbi:MAG: hypothetical protein IAF94_06520 [Pirellulaceae bacterium]|nr:hypothetical protein [Pirellulaceae bacterium]
MKVLLPMTVFLAFAGLALWPATLIGQVAKPKLEDELVDDLLKDLPKARPEAPAKGKIIKPAAKDEAEKKLLQDLEGGEDIGLPPENPLIRIGQKMRSSQERIAGKDTSAQTQTGQKEILSELAKLIEQTRKQCNAGGNGKPGNGKASAQSGAGTGDARPGQASEATDRVGKGEREDAETADVKDVLRRIWGHLPEKVREQMQAQLSEQFLPKYEKLIEEYYKRLAEERADK